MAKTIKLTNNTYWDAESVDNRYSEEEKRIGIWFGKPLYRKTINFGALPNASQKSVAHNILNVEKIWIDMSHSYFVNAIGGYYPVNDYDWHPFVNATHLYVTVENIDRRDCSMIITILYTKTTD